LQIRAGKDKQALESLQATNKIDAELDRWFEGEQLKDRRAREAAAQRERLAAESNKARLQAAQMRHPTDRAAQVVGVDANGDVVVRKPDGTTETLTGVKPAKTSPVGAKGDAYGFGEIVATAANEAAVSLSNLTEFPVSTTSGLFGGRTTTSLFTAPLDAMANSLTSETIQRYNAEINNIGKFVAQIQKGGRVVAKSDIDTTTQAFKIVKGDKPLTALAKFAQARQALEKALEVRIASPKTPEELKEILRKNQKEITEAIPFTVADVNNFANSRDGKKTFADSFKEQNLANQPAPAPSASNLTDEEQAELEALRKKHGR